MSNIYFNNSKRGISPIILNILIIIISIALVISIVTWSNSFTNNTLDESDTVNYDPSALEGYIFSPSVYESSTGEVSKVLLENSNTLKDLKIVSYKILDANPTVERFVNTKYDLETPVTVTKGNGRAQIPIKCIPSKSFILELYTSNDKYLQVPIKYLAASLESCGNLLYCGNGVCDADEQILSCLQDCLICGDGICTNFYEDPTNCSLDCSPRCSAFEEVTLYNSVNHLGSAHSCFILSNNEIKCVGDNTYGQLGDGTVIDKLTPVTVSGISNSEKMSLGANHSCSLLTDNTVKCWGYNEYGQLGNDTIIDSDTPVSVNGINSAIEISLRSHHSCVLLDTGYINCWGFNNHGQLGNNSPVNSSTPVEVYNINNAIDISLGGLHTCALVDTNTVKCWGYNAYGRLGDGTTTDSFLPVDVSNLNNVAKISLGIHHSCALLNDNSLKCWGYNLYGQVGDGTETHRYTPVSISGISNAVNISLGGHHSCASLSDGTVKCWGRNNYGQLGDGTINDSNVPVAVSGISNAVNISLGTYHSCALLSDDSIKCWGNNSDGQLSDGTITERHTPVIAQDVVPSLPTYSVGDTGPASGTVFYDKENYDNCWQYLSVKTTDEANSDFGCNTTEMGTDADIGNGLLNTENIVNNCTEATAADICNNLSSGGATDWYLPSLDELTQLNTSTVKTTNLDYISSTEVGASNVYNVNLSTGVSLQVSKSTSSSVVCVRRFRTEYP